MVSRRVLSSASRSFSSVWSFCSSRFSDWTFPTEAFSASRFFLWLSSDTTSTGSSGTFSAGFSSFWRPKRRLNNPIRFLLYFSTYFSIAQATASSSFVIGVTTLATSLTAATAFCIATPSPAHFIIDRSFASSPQVMT